MTQVINQRIGKLRKTLLKQKLDALLILVGENRYYLSGFSGEDTQFDESAGALLISQNGLILATDSRYEQQARREAPLYQTVCYREGLAGVLPRLLKKQKIRELGFESRRISVSQYHAMNEAIEKNGYKVLLIETKDLVETLRMKKIKTETSMIQQALKIAETSFEKMIRYIRPGMSEMETAWTLEKELRENGAEGLSFPTIVASGPNSALPHAIPGNRKLKSGEPILFDWGVRLGGYCSDISRTIVIGKPDNTFKSVYQTVQDAQKKAIAAVRSGSSTRQVDAVARKHIEKKGFKGRFGHGLGHGVGLAIHEHPRLSPHSDTVISPGMVFTMEPGIYLPGWGGVRIENMVRVHRKGNEVLNRLGTDLMRIEA
ncbi:aminopeptidase P family protein [Thermodesulfobacteriota bacterium]